MPAMLLFKVSIRNSRPTIWRRVVVPATFTFANLHRVLQRLFNWEGTHLHEFNMDTSRPRTKIPARTPLVDFFERPKQSCIYLYDFGDNWEHEIVFEGGGDPKATTPFPVCLAGACNAPPDDCGGIYGYYAMLKAVKTPKHPDHQMLTTWLGPFDPHHFDLAAVNARLKRMRGAKQAKS